MKILSVAWTVQDANVPTLHNELTGAGIVIRNIAEYIGRKEKSYLFIGKLPVKNMVVKNINYVSNNLEGKDYNDNEVRLNIIINAFEKCLEDIRPDIVNFHGEGDFICSCIKICQQKRIPFVVTIHLYVGRNQNIKGYEKAKKYWDDLFNLAGVKYITVGTGLKQKILRDYCKIKETDVQVIKNGTNYQAIPTESELKSQLQIKNHKILILAGTINERKNQIQVAETYMLLPEPIKNKIKIIFCGIDDLNGKLQNFIKSNGLEKNVFYVGAVPAKDMCKYYSISDGYIMPSLAEGLSISELEAICFGIPLIMFADSECAYDLYDDKIVVLAEQRTNDSLRDAIVKWYENDWNKNYIAKKAKLFSMERVADDYIKYYKEFVK